MKSEDIEVALEDLDIMVEQSRLNLGMVGFLSIVHSANLIKQTLEKQTPKEIVSINDNESYFVCSCGFTVGYFEDSREHKYCLNCGQKIEWD